MRETGGEVERKSFNIKMLTVYFSHYSGTLKPLDITEKYMYRVFGK